MDPIQTLNQIFPTPESLENIDEASDYVELCGQYLRFQLANALSRNHGDARDAAIKAPAQLNQLATEMREMQQVGSQTRADVHKMTKDIKQLDKTKDNLVQSVTMLKRLQMLAKVYSQLEYLLKNRQYREMAQTVSVASELMDHFRPFRSLPQVAELSQRIGEIQTLIFEQIQADFKEVVAGKPDPSNGGLAYACQALDSLEFSKDHQARDKLVKWYCGTLLKEYNEIFRVGDEAGSLENVDRRYGYLKKVLHQHAEHEQIFAKDWHVGKHLAQYACDRTKQDIAVLLEQFSSSRADVQLLLTTLHETTEFEQYLGRKFGQGFTGAISPVFMPYLSVWIDYQDRQLSQKIQGFRNYTPGQAPPEEGEPQPDVIPSSANLFIYYRQVLAQMAKMSTGEPLLLLSGVFAKWLSVYSTNVLAPYIPDFINSDDDLATIGMVLKTADYCMATTNQLEQTIAEQLEAPLAERLDMERPREAFIGVVNKCLAALVDYVERRTEGSWREMANIDWGHINRVGDQSLYVSHLCAVVKDSTKQVLAHVHRPAHARLVCDRIVEAISLAYLTAGMRTKPVREPAAEQMLLDLYMLKGALLELLSLSPEYEGKPEKLEAYRQVATKTIARVENVFKLLLNQIDPADSFVRTYMVLVGDRSVANFRKILETKGARVMNKSVETFRLLSSQNYDLIPESPLLAAVQLNRPPRARSPNPAPANEAVFKLNENFKRFGEFLRRDQGSPLRR